MATVRLADPNGPKWTSSGQNGPKWTILVHFGLAKALNPVRNKVISTKMVVWTILDHFGPVHFPTVPRPLPIKGPSVPVREGGSVPPTGPLVPLQRDPFPVQAFFNCVIVSLGPWAFNCQGSGVSLRI